MSRPRLRRVAILGILLWLGIIACASSQKDTAARPREVTLSHQSPQAAFPLDQQRLEEGKTVFSVGLLRTVNPDHAEFSVDVKLASCSSSSQAHEEPVGSLGIYPASQVGGEYSFDLAPALKQMSRGGQSAQDICLKLQLKPLRASTNWRRLQVTVSSPRWP